MTASPMTASLIGHLYGISILVLMGLFLGIWAWAWSRHNKKTFDAAARLPLEHDRMLPHSEENAR